MNYGCVPASRELKIENLGLKTVGYKVDSTPSDYMQLIPYPKSGVLAAKKCTNLVILLHHAMLGYHKKNIYLEMISAEPIIIQGMILGWISCRCYDFIVIVVDVTIIRPKFEIIYSNVAENLMICDFGAVYFGSERSDSFYLRNYSAMASTFLIMAIQPDKNSKPFNYWINVQRYDGEFYFSPMTGTIKPFEKQLIQIQ